MLSRTQPDTVAVMLAELVLQSALHFLNTEVPRWERENHCYSCHNNGDAARALYLAKQRGYDVPRDALATYMSMRTLDTADARRFAAPIARADRWLAATKPANLTDAAALLLARPSRRDCLELILSSQTSDGGWGPQPKLPAEAFDTAL